jgi:hypothetical protein
MRRQRYSSSARSAARDPERPGTSALAGAALVRGYQVLLRPLFGPACRFAPSCSEYARQAILAYGVGRGALLAVRRIARCHPWDAGGYDPVPARKR